MNDDFVLDEDEIRYWPHNRLNFDYVYDAYYARKWYWVQCLGAMEYSGTIQ